MDERYQKLLDGRDVVGLETTFKWLIDTGQELPFEHMDQNTFNKLIDNYGWFLWIMKHVGLFEIGYARKLLAECLPHILTWMEYDHVGLLYPTFKKQFIAWAQDPLSDCYKGLCKSDILDALLVMDYDIWLEWISNNIVAIIRYNKSIDTIRLLEKLFPTMYVLFGDHLRLLIEHNLLSLEIERYIHPKLYPYGIGEHKLGFHKKIRKNQLESVKWVLSIAPDDFMHKRVCDMDEKYVFDDAKIFHCVRDAEMFNLLWSRCSRLDQPPLSDKALSHVLSICALNRRGGTIRGAFEIVPNFMDLIEKNNWSLARLIASADVELFDDIYYDLSPEKQESLLSSGGYHVYCRLIWLENSYFFHKYWRKLSIEEQTEAIIQNDNELILTAMRKSLHIAIDMWKMCPSEFRESMFDDEFFEATLEMYEKGDGYMIHEIMEWYEYETLNAFIDAHGIKIFKILARFALHSIMKDIWERIENRYMWIEQVMNSEKITYYCDTVNSAAQRDAVFYIIYQTNGTNKTCCLGSDYVS